MAKYAVLDGINRYTGAASPLKGCVNDVVDSATVIVNKYDFKRRNVHLVTDERAKTAGIWAHWHWLRDVTQPDDVAFIQHSGHGTRRTTRTPELEPDGWDEVICPQDFDWDTGKMIVDKEIDAFLKTFKPGVRIYIVFDSCYSGDGLRTVMPNGSTSRFVPVRACDAFDLETLRLDGFKREERKVAAGLNVGFISGCGPNQTSADAQFAAGRSNGALTYTMLHAMEKFGVGASGRDLTNAIKSELKTYGFDQEPQPEGPLVDGRPWLS